MGKGKKEFVVLIRTILITSFTICFIIYLISISYVDKKQSIAHKNLYPKYDLVLRHYEKEKSDSLKLIAARFLIENMHFHFSRRCSYKYDFAFDSISRYPMIVKRRGVFKSLLDSISKVSQQDEIKTYYDAEYLDSDFLIENIELAFAAWQLHPLEKRADFDTFCNYILPYRNGDEPVEKGIRKKILDEYNWVLDSLNNGIPLKKIVENIMNEANFQNLADLRRYYPLTLSFSQYERSKIGTCQDKVNYIIQIFRALGIACSDESVMHWGNHHSSGHSWFRIEYGAEIYYADNIKSKYKYESIPKVYRRQFHINKSANGKHRFYKDVTDEYKSTVSISVPHKFIRLRKLTKPEIFVFDVAKEWVSVCEGYKKNEKYYFENLGSNVLYLSGELNSGKIYPINYPFFINQDSKVRYFVPQKETFNSVQLLRKSGFITPRNKSKLEWLQCLNGSVIQGANDIEFHDAQNLGIITNLSSTQPQVISISDTTKYLYYRFFSANKNTYLAKLEFRDSNGEQITGNIIKENNIDMIWGDGAFDNDPLTFSAGECYNFSLGLMLEEPKAISSVKYQARNDDNHIRIGDQYELFYWDKEWLTLGKQFAADTLLTYNNVPKNAVFWLRNLSRGKEENIFSIDEKGKQIWLGFIK